MADTEFLDNERKKVWARLVELEADIKKKTSDYESEAKQAAKKCAEYRNKCETTRNEAEVFLKNIQGASDEIKKSNVSLLISDIQTFHTELTPKKEAIDNQVTKLEELFENYESYAEKLQKLEEIHTTADDSSAKIETIFSQLTSRKKEVDQLYFEVFGFTKTDEATGKEIKVSGKKEELDQAYAQLKIDFEAYTGKKNAEIDKALKQWEKTYQATLANVEDLLPRALTAGLSSAHSEKVATELREREKLSASFKHWIWGLIAISLIPFGVSTYLLFLKIPLLEVLQKMPSLVSAILPLYIPPLWIAFSTSKKINVSKRLIEEYTHKEVVSKTYEGLSKQIDDIRNTKTSEELRTKLLRNILDVSVENPGKLLSDYNESDHPMLGKIPRISRLFGQSDTKPTE